jgi:plastocyanin
MNASPSTPLNRLILLVLCLNFICLALLLCRTFTKPAPDLANIDVEPAAPLQLAPSIPQTRPIQNSTSPRTQALPIQRTVVAANRPEKGVSFTPATAAPAPVAEPVSPAAQPPVSLVNLPQQPAPPVAPPKTDGLPELVGRVVLVGTPRAEIPIEMDPACGQLHKKRVTTRHYVRSSDGGLANVLVWLKGEVPWTTNAGGAQMPAVILDQRGCMFEPYVLGVLAGQKVQILNSDNLLHNVHATPRSNKEFNFGSPWGGSPLEVTFAKPELSVRLKCDVHPWMLAYVHVLQHPFFSITDTNGAFRLPTGFPPGRYIVGVHHLKAGEINQEMELRPGLQEVSFEMQALDHVQAKAR